MMKKYDLLISVGCSFTEGGGLNDPKYHNYLTGVSFDEGDSPTESQNEYANYHSFPGYLSRLLECDFINLGKSAASNELIFKNLYSAINNNYEGKILVTLQTTILSRMLYYLVDKKKFVNRNGAPGGDPDTELHYNNYITKFFDKNIEYKKLLQNVDIYTTWLLNKNIDVVWIPFDIQGTLTENKITINFGNNESLLDFSTNQKLRILDLSNISYQDYHITEVGNEIIARKIYEHVKRHYND